MWSSCAQHSHSWKQQVWTNSTIFFNSFGTYAESCFTNSVVQISVLTWQPTRGEMMCMQLHVCHKFSQKTQRGDWMIPAASWPDTIFLHSQHPVWCPEKTNHAVNVTLILLNCCELNFPLIFCRSPTMGAVASGAENVAKLWSRSNLCSRRFCRFAHSGYIRETKNWMRGFFLSTMEWNQLSLISWRARRTNLCSLRLEMVNFQSFCAWHSHWPRGCAVQFHERTIYGHNWL